MKFMRIIRILLAVLLFTTVSYAKKIVKDKTVITENGITIDFKDLEIKDFIKTVAEITGKNILVSDKIKGKINFVSHEPIPEKKIYNLLLTILKNKGYTIVDTGSGFLNVIRLSTAVKNNLPVMKRSDLPQMITQIIKVKRENVDIVASKIRHLLSKSGKLITSKETNNLIISDFNANIETIKSVIKLLERSSEKSVKFIKIENAKVAKIYSQVIKISKNIFNQKVIEEKIEILKDDASNTIIIIGKKGNLDILENYILKLDIKDEITKQDIYVIPLVNSDSKDVAKILTSIMAKKSSYIKDKSIPKTMITSNESLNSLIIVATADDIREIRSVVKMLDVEKQQVYIRAKIVEVSKQKAKKIGIELLDNSLTFIGSSNSFDLLSSKILSLAQSLPQQKKTRYYNEQTKQYEYEITQQGVDINNYTSGLVIGANLSFLKRNGVANMLSEPTLLCLDNKESSIKVGEVRSILISQKGATANSDGESKYSRENIGLDLKIKPRISNDNKVTLDINIKLEEAQVSIYDNGRPTTTNREIKTTTIVKNGESIIIGGLTKSTSSNSKNKIPLLGDIPFIGDFFTSNRENNDQINLVIVLTPYLIGKDSNISKLKKELEHLDRVQKEISKLYDDTFANSNSKSQNNSIIKNEEEIAEIKNKEDKNPYSILTDDDEEF